MRKTTQKRQHQKLSIKGMRMRKEEERMGVVLLAILIICFCDIPFFQKTALSQISISHGPSFSGWFQSRVGMGEKGRKGTNVSKGKALPCDGPRQRPSPFCFAQFVRIALPSPSLSPLCDKCSKAKKEEEEKIPARGSRPLERRDGLIISLKGIPLFRPTQICEMPQAQLSPNQIPLLCIFI